MLLNIVTVNADKHCVNNMWVASGSTNYINLLYYKHSIENKHWATQQCNMSP